jgi:hypothetical protein
LFKTVILKYGGGTAPYIHHKINHNLEKKLDSFYECYQRAEASGGSIVSDYGLDDRGSIPGRGRGFFF